MPHTTEDLLKLASQFEELTKTAKKEKKKLDPKAKVRNRGTVCVPASSAKDHKDHFPINDEDQARNALARVHQYDKAPEWYSGSLKGLQDLVSRKVHSKYPSIGKDKKKSSWEVVQGFMTKYGNVQEATAFLNHYGSTAEALRDIAKAQFELSGLDPNNPEAQKDESFASAKTLHDMIEIFARQLEAEESKHW